MKILVAFINTILSSAIIFGILFGFGMAGGFKENVRIEKVIVIAVPFLVFGILYGWNVAFRSQSFTSGRMRTVLSVAALITGVLLIMIAGQVGPFIYL